jgi:hypothetical protein
MVALPPQAPKFFFWEGKKKDTPQKAKVQDRKMDRVHSYFLLNFDAPRFPEMDLRCCLFLTTAPTCCA